MENTKKERIKTINRKFIWIGLLDCIPAVMLGVVIYDKSRGDLGPEFIQNENISNGLLILSVGIIAYCTYKAYQYSKQVKQINEEQN